MKIWLDDFRPAPEGFVWVKDYFQAKKAFKANNGLITDASLDHDLNFNFVFEYGKEYTGYDVVKFIGGFDPYDLAQGKGPKETYWPTKSLAVHTDNSWGRGNMVSFIERYGPYAIRLPYEVQYGGFNAKASGYIFYMTEEDAYGSQEGIQKPLEETEGPDATGWPTSGETFGWL